MGKVKPPKMFDSMYRKCQKYVSYDLCQSPLFESPGDINTAFANSVDMHYC